MYTLLMVLHVVAATLLIGVVLLQQGKGADMGAVFGGSSSTIFGSSGAGNFLTRLTAALAAVFMFTSLTLTYTGARRVSSTVFDSAPLPDEPPPLEVPANPAGGVPGPEAAAPAQQAEGQAPAAGEAPAAAPQPAAPAEAPAAPQAAAPEAAPPAAADPAPATN